MTNRFPKDKPPREYMQDFYTRAFEDIYKDLDGVDGALGQQIKDIQSKVRGLNQSVGNVKTTLAQNFVGQESPLPIPVNLKIYKVPLIPLIVMWCDPIEIIKYPYIGGIQFFASSESDFTPLETCAHVTYSGNCTVSSGGNVMADTSNVTVSGIPKFVTKYTGIPFWDDMDLVADAITCINTTDDSTGTITAWSKTTPWQFTCALSGGSDDTWQNGDGYRFVLQRNKNLIGQGPLPFAVQLFPGLQLANSKWDAFAVYGKARFYGKGLPKQRRYGQLACASNTAFEDQELTKPSSLVAEPFTEDNAIQVSWTAGHEGGDAFAGYRLYRTTANTTALLTDDTYLIADNLTVTEYLDHGYDATGYPNGPSAGATYWYWVRVADTGGFQSDVSNSDDAILAIPNAPTFISGAEDGAGYGNLKNWLVQWKATGGALGYFVKYKVVGGDYSLETYVPHTTAFGQDGGEDIQQFTFMGLETGTTYTFAVKSVNNQEVAILQSAYTEQNYAIQESGVPLPPT